MKSDICKAAAENANLFPISDLQINTATNDCEYDPDKISPLCIFTYSIAPVTEKHTRIVLPNSLVKTRSLISELPEIKLHLHNRKLKSSFSYLLRWCYGLLLWSPNILRSLHWASFGYILINKQRTKQLNVNCVNPFTHVSRLCLGVKGLQLFKNWLLCIIYLSLVIKTQNKL